MVEFVATKILAETDVGGCVNSGWDLVANLVGCLVAAVLIHGLSRRSAKGHPQG